MSELRLSGVFLAYGDRALLDGVDLALARGERVCLTGRNGEGKSSLLRVASGETAPDAGEVRIPSGARVARLDQEAGAPGEATVFEAVAAGLADTGALLAEYHYAAAGLAADPAAAPARRLADLESRIEAAGAWAHELRIETMLTHLGLDGSDEVATLSGGWRRRVMLARALAGAPDFLLLDEPTNHLDLDAIGWLEEHLAGYRGGLLFVTHDRAFLRRLATRIVDLDRGRLTSWPGDYDAYLRRRAAALEAEAAGAAEADRKLAREEAWVRRGIKARRTRNEGRVRALEALRAERRRRRDRAGTALLRLDDGERSGRLVLEAEGLTHGFGGTPVVRDLSLRIMRGDRVGIVGPNGAGKTTLLRLLLGELAPDAGVVRRGTRLEVAYFDQQRERLDGDAMVMDAVAGGRQAVTVGGRTRHVAGYLRDFAFPASRLASPVRSLSGGERNRLLLARIFTRPANLLVLDEPTNDLDVETLERLEALVADFTGTLLLVSHDREFLDNVVTSVLAFEGEGRVTESVGGYSDWLTRRERPSPPRVGPAPRPAPARKASREAKLSYREQQELDGLPAAIEALEAERAALEESLARPEFYRGPGEEIAAATARLEALGEELEGRYARWEDLESRAGNRGG